MTGDDPARLAEAVGRYTARYRTAPPTPPDLVVVEITVDRVLSLGLRPARPGIPLPKAM